jgi:hypothetical protein
MSKFSIKSTTFALLSTANRWNWATSACYAYNTWPVKKGWRVQSYLISIANNISPNNMYREMDLSFSWAHENSIENVHLYLLCSKICCQLKITLYNQSLIRCSKTGSTRCVFNSLCYTIMKWSNFMHNIFTDGLNLFWAVFTIPLVI